MLKEIVSILFKAVWLLKMYKRIHMSLIKLFYDLGSYSFIQVVFIYMFYIMESICLLLFSVYSCNNYHFTIVVGNFVAKMLTICKIFFLCLAVFFAKLINYNQFNSHIL